jgi:hypothetical protein
MVNTRNAKPGSEPFVLPNQCEQVFYSEVQGRGVWSYVVRYDPSGRSIKYNVVEEDNVEEKLVHVLDKDIIKVQGDVLDNVLDEYDIDDVLDEELEEVEPNAGDNVLDDDIDNDMIRNDDTDHDVDMANPFNINSELDDTDVELDEE